MAQQLSVRPRPSCSGCWSGLWGPGCFASSVPSRILSNASADSRIGCICREESVKQCEMRPADGRLPQGIQAAGLIGFEGSRVGRGRVLKSCAIRCATQIPIGANLAFNEINWLAAQCLSPTPTA